MTFRIGKYLVQTLLGLWPGFATQPCYKAPSDLQVKISTVKPSDEHWVSEALPSTVAQIWLWGSQKADKKNHFNQPKTTIVSLIYCMFFSCRKIYFSVFRILKMGNLS